MSGYVTTPEEPKSDFLSRPLLGATTLDWEKAIYIAFIVFAIVTRFWGLGDRVMSHDESLHTQFSYQYYDGQGYQHTPLMHGPFLFHATAAAYWLFGDNDYTARVPVAILGIILVVMPYFLRPWLGRVGAIFASFVFLISPYITYYSRYIRHDIYVIVWAMIVFTAIWYYFRERKDKYLWWFAAGTALMFATKEVAFIYVAIFGSFLVIRLAAQVLPAPWFRDALPRLRPALLVMILGLVFVGAGFVGQRSTGVVRETAATVEATEGFAVDPTAEQATDAAGEVGSSLELAMRWLQIAGIGVLSLGLFLAARATRPELEQFAAFDLIILFTTLILPFASPFLTTIAGWNPTDYTISQCVLQGQESMSSLQVLLARMTTAECYGALLQSGIIRSGIFLIISMVVAALVGFWWDRRRWIIAAGIFGGITLVLYTSLFTNPAGWQTGVIGSLGYWLEQQEVQRGSQPWYYYFFVTPFYEFLPLIFSLLAIRLWAQKERVNRMLGYWIGLILLALLGYSFTNWLYAALTQDPLTVSEGTILPGLVVAGTILLVALAFWLFRYRGRLIREYDLERSVGELFDPQALLGFVPFVIWWLLLTWVAYSYAGEKMPWLSTHFVIPMGLLTGWYFNEKLAHLDAGRLFSRTALALLGLTVVLIVAALLVIGPLLLGEISLGNQQLENLSAIGRLIGSILIVGVIYFFWRRFFGQTEESLRRPLLLLSVFALLSLLTLRFTYLANFPNADYTTEFMVYAHGAPATKDVVLEQVEELSMRMHGDKSIKVAFDSDVSWPLTWYLREYPNRVFFGENPSQSLRESPVIIVGAKNWDKVEPYLGNEYEQTEHTFLWWPMEEYRKFSWNAFLGNPDVPAEERRGLGDADVRQALWDIFFYRDYEKYGEVFGGTYTAGQWPLRHNLRLYIRRDTLPMLWDYGVGAVAAGGITDPYAEGELPLSPNLVLNESGFAGSGLGELSSPRNMVVGPDDRIYVADSGNHRIQVFEQDGTPVDAWGSFGTEPGQFNEPWGLAVDDDFVYVADTWNHRIQKFTLEGEFIEAFGMSGSPDIAAGDEGLGLFFGPRSVVLLDENRLLVTDTGNHRMQVLDRQGNFIQQVGGFGNIPGQMNEPVGLSRGPNGNVYLADTWNSRVQQFTPELFAVNEFFVDAWDGTSINNKPYTAVDSAGRVYVTDPEGYRVLVFSPDGSYLGRFGSFGTEPDRFGLPNGIFIDSEDYVYIADAGNNRIVKLAPVFGPAAVAPEEAPLDAITGDENSAGEGEEQPDAEPTTGAEGEN